MSTGAKVKELQLVSDRLRVLVKRTIRESFESFNDFDDGGVGGVDQFLF